MPSPMLQINSLTKTYADGTEAVRGIDLDISDGVFGLLGENGAGKSTTLSVVALQVAPTSGTVLHQGLDGRDPRNHSIIRRRLGFLPQEFRPIGCLTGWEYLTYCARLREVGLPRRRVRERVGRLLEAVDLLESAGRPTAEYSGGMTRRLGVCQALVHDPDLVILDEPSAGLDPEQRMLLRGFIAEMGRRHTILLSSHVVDDIDQTCREMAVVSSGRLLYRGSPSDLLRRASTQRSTSEQSPRPSLEAAYQTLLVSARDASGPHVSP